MAACKNGNCVKMSDKLQFVESVIRKMDRIYLIDMKENEILLIMSSKLEGERQTEVCRTGYELSTVWAN